MTGSRASDFENKHRLTMSNRCQVINFQLSLTMGQGGGSPVVDSGVDSWTWSYRPHYVHRKVSVKCSESALEWLAVNLPSMKAS